MTVPPSRDDPGAFWDDKYREADHRFGTRPNAFLVEQSYRLPPRAQVLCAGDGEGRNGVWLAGQGHKVVSVDVSPRALQKASRLALDKGVFLSTVCADLADWDWPVAAYDAATAIFLHLPPAARAVVHGGLLRALKPGGLILLEAFSPAQLGRSSGGPRDVALLYDAATLRGDFAGAAVIELAETETVLDEGPHHRGPAAVVRLVARAPAG